jgi:5,10-methenyltetrahydrofolate synthetase
MTKSEIRKIARTESLKGKWSFDSLVNALKSVREFQDFSVILSYRPMKDEIDLNEALAMLFPEKIILYPVVRGNEMFFAKADEFIKGYKDIEEPDTNLEYEYEKAIIVTPGLAFDRKCNRLGRGKGYYDRYIKAHREKLFVLAIGKKNQLREDLPIDFFDEKTDLTLILSEADGSFVKAASRENS